MTEEEKTLNQLVQATILIKDAYQDSKSSSPHFKAVLLEQFSSMSAMLSVYCAETSAQMLTDFERQLVIQEEPY